MGLAPNLRCPGQFPMSRGISKLDRFSELFALRVWTRTQKFEGLMERSFDLCSRIHGEGLPSLPSEDVVLASQVGSARSSALEGDAL